MRKVLIILYFVLCLLFKVQAQTIDDCNLTVNNIEWGTLTAYCSEETPPYISFWWDKNTSKVELQYGDVDFKLGEGITLGTEDYYIIDLPKTELKANKEYSYYVRACCNGNCGEWSERKYFDTKPTSGIYLEQNDQILVYPNPTNGEFKIELDESFKSGTNLEIALTNMDGKIVQNMKQQEIYDLSQHPSGLYILTIKNDKSSVHQIIQKQ